MSQRWSSISGILVALLLSACGGGGGGSAPSSQGSYDLQAGMQGLIQNGLSANVTLSGTAIVNSTSYSFTGTGTLTVAPAVSGTFNGATALLQTETIAGTISVAGESSPYSSSVVNVYEPTTGSIVGETQSNEFDVASSPIVIPTTVGTTSTTLGSLNRYTDSTMSVALGTVQVSVAIALIPVDTGSPEVVQFTYKIYDTSQTLVETDIFAYYLTENNVLSFDSASTQTASGTLDVLPQ